jgi:hypothetical protein
MNAMKAANKELKGMMKTVKIEDIDVCGLAFALFVLPCMVWVLCCCHFEYSRFNVFFPSYVYDVAL